MTYPGVDPALDPDRAAVEQRRKEREIEFSTYRATQDIPWGTVIAFHGPRGNVPGEIVPKSTVEARGWLDLGLVERIDQMAQALSQPGSGFLAAADQPSAAPARNASKAEWVDYAVARRDPNATEADARGAAESKTRDELVAQFGQEG